MNLYEISARYQQLLDMEELTAEECAELEAMHDNVEDACIEKAKYIRNLEAQTAAIETAVSEMRDRLATMQAKIDRQRDFLLLKMNDCNITKITKCPLFAITIPKPRASVSILDDTQIPEKYRSWTEPKPVEKISKELIKADLDAGIEVPGATLSYNAKIVFK